MKKFYILLIVLISLFVKAYCQPITLGFGVNDWGNQTGIYSSAWTKTAIAVDSSGNKWIGYIEDIGVNKFNGSSWTQYNVSNGNLPSDSITSFAIKGNTVFVGTKNGIAKFDNGNWSTINTSNSQLASNVINSLFYKNNVLWVGTNSGVSKLGGTIWTNYNTSNSQLCNNNVQAIEQSPNGDIWFGTSNGLSKLSGSVWTSYNTVNSGLGENNIISLYCDNNNQLFIGTNGKGGFVMKNNSIQSLLATYPKLLAYIYDPAHTNNLQAKIYDFVKDLQGNIYLSTVRGIGNATACFFIRLSLNDCKIYRLPINAIPWFYEFESPETIWYVNSYDGSSIYPSRSLYSFKLSDGILRDDYAFLDVNNVKAGISSSGFLFNDYLLTESPSYFTVPKDSNKSSIYSGSLWLGALDLNGNLKLAAERYRTTSANQTFESRDFQSGPISIDTTIYKMEKEKWNHIWKVSKLEIDYHKTHYSTVGYIIPKDIASWPGNGIPSNGQSQYLAPYVDANANGYYDPQNGDYPIIRGNQALYFIFNDDKVHTESNGAKLNVEIHGMAYAFNIPNDTAINNTIFINYLIYNRSLNDYNNFYIGSLNDIDLGYAFDDYIGCDSTLSTYYAYNGINVDGNGQSYAYGSYPPAQGVSFLNDPMQKFVYYNNTNSSINGDPSNTADYYNYLKGIWKDGRPMTYGGDGTMIGGTTCNFMFPGMPGTNYSWNEITAFNAPGDRRGLGSTGPFTLLKDSCHCIDLAYTFARNITDTNKIASVSTLKQYVQHIKNYYNTNLNHNCSDLFSTIKDINTSKAEMLIYPNPANDKITISLPKTLDLQNARIYIYSIQGQLLMQESVKQQSEIYIHSLSKGIYIVKVLNNKNTMMRKFVKE
ncbi:MAG: T9SS type A sorting domain-containing protein [Bacteroidales bacterium]